MDLSFKEKIKQFTRRDRTFDFLIEPQPPKFSDQYKPILFLEDVSVSFDGFKAIDQLNLYINTGELRCIIGPNGSGKSTMMDIITGKTTPDTGSVWFKQTMNLLEMSEADIAQSGIGRKFQKPSVFENLTVYQNLELAMAQDKRTFALLKARLTPIQKDRICAVLEQIGLINQRESLAGNLSHGQKQWLEIGMLLMQGPELLLVDEPVAGMTHQEMDRTAELLTSLSGTHSVIVVEHDMAFIRSIATKVTVLHQGRVLAEGSMDQIHTNPEVVEVYLGES